MSAEYAGKRQMGIGSGDSRTTAVRNPAETSATSSADLESMLKQALGRIDCLERQFEDIKTSMGRETKALRENICSLKEENKAIQASTGRQIEFLRHNVESLQIKNKALKWSLDRLASKVQEGWEYPVVIQPDEYWQNKGYDDYDIHGLRGFLGGLKDAVSQLEHGVFESVLISHANRDEDLMPHWNALFRSFEHINPYDAGVRLVIHSIDLNEEIMRQICHHIRYKNISRVYFAHTEFTNMQAAISELGEAMKSPKLKYLDWFGNSIYNTEDMTLFTQALSQSNAVDKLKFTSNGNENAQALLAGVDFSTYKLLHFCGNDLQTNGRTDIPDLIASNPPLEELDLCQNRLNDDDAVLIAQSLGGNTRLRLLNVRWNNIQKKGMRALYEAVNDTSTLNALSDGNHSCRLEGLSDDFDLDAINRDRGPNGLRTNRMIKIQKLMLERYRNGDGNVPHLNTEMSGECSVLLAPYLMDCVVRRHDDAFPKWYDEDFEYSLGLLYELVKDWKMAELFSFR